MLKEEMFVSGRKRKKSIRLYMTSLASKEHSAGGTCHLWLQNWPMILWFWWSYTLVLLFC